MTRHALLALGMATGLAFSAAAQQQRHPKNDFPTAARADYVIGCLMDHDFKHEFLEPCSCQVDMIADELTADQFDQATTVLGVQRTGGMGRANDLFRDTPQAHAIMAKFKHAKAEADKSCK